MTATYETGRYYWTTLGVGLRRERRRVKLARVLDKAERDEFNGRFDCVIVTGGMHVFGRLAGLTPGDRRPR